MRYYYKKQEDERFQLTDSPQENCWIHVDEANHQDLLKLSGLIQLETTDLQDCLDRFEIPRIEKIDNTIIIFTRYPIEYETGLYTASLAIIITPSYFVTVTPVKSRLINNLLSQKNTLSSLQKSEILISILYKITQEFTLHIRRVRHNVLKQEREMINVDSENITELTKSEEILNQYLSSLIPIKHVLNETVSERYKSIYQQDQDSLEDLYNAIKQSEDLCNISLKSIRSLRDSYQIIFTNNLHKTIKLLTALTIIFNIPTIIASLYGMNVALPLASNPLAFLYIIGGTGLTILLTAFYFQKKLWL
jgi:magnesium transporter